MSAGRMADCAVEGSHLFSPFDYRNLVIYTIRMRHGQAPEAQAANRKPLSMGQQEPERRYLERRLQEVEKNSLDVCRIWGAAKRLRVQDQNKKQGEDLFNS